MIKTTTKFSIEQIAEKFDLSIVGDNFENNANVNVNSKGNVEANAGQNCKRIIEGIATLEHAQSTELSFFANKKYKNDFLETKAAAIIVQEVDSVDCPGIALVADNPYLVYAKVADFLTRKEDLTTGIHPSAVVHHTADIPETCTIDANVVIGQNVVIGDYTHIEAGCVVNQDSSLGAHCHLYPNVTIYHAVRIQDKVIIHAGSVIGSDGFGIANDKGKWLKVPQLGGVKIGNNVELGACCTIDRGALEDTIIEDGVKLDNQVHIAHNDVIGENTAIAAQVGIAGSTHIGKNCAFGGQVGIVGHASIADEVQITGGSRVLSSITESGTYTSGTPLQETSLWHKNHVRFKQLDSLYRQLKKISKAIITD